MHYFNKYYIKVKHKTTLVKEDSLYEIAVYYIRRRDVKRFSDNFNDFVNMILLSGYNSYEAEGDKIFSLLGKYCKV